MGYPSKSAQARQGRVILRAHKLLNQAIADGTAVDQTEWDDALREFVPSVSINDFIAQAAKEVDAESER